MNERMSKWMSKWMSEWRKERKPPLSLHKEDIQSFQHSSIKNTLLFYGPYWAVYVLSPLLWASIAPNKINVDRFLPCVSSPGLWLIRGNGTVLEHGFTVFVNSQPQFTEASWMLLIPSVHSPRRMHFGGSIFAKLQGKLSGDGTRVSFIAQPICNFVLVSPSPSVLTRIHF